MKDFRTRYVSFGSTKHAARLIATLLKALEMHDLKRAVAVLCIGGGEATAIAIKRIVN